MTRAEFLVLCMKITGHSADTATTGTGFEDDERIGVWARPYVSEALRCGIVSGYENASDAVSFDPDRSISAAEAAVMLDRAAELTDAVAAWYCADDAIPAWAVQSAANVSACNLLPCGCSFLDETLTRADAAELLCSAMELLSRR